jgi:phosphoglycolate phosphatase
MEVWQLEDSIDGIIFDFDGVIVDTFEMSRAMINQLSLKYGSGKQWTPEEYARVFVKNPWIAFEEQGLRVLSDPRIPQEYHELQAEAYKAHPPRIFDGITEVICTLEAYHRLFIESSNYESRITNYLHQHRLDGAFVSIVGAEYVRSKEKRLCKLKELNREKNFIYITDTSGEIAEAKKVGIPAIGVTWGYHSKDLLLPAEPVRIVTQPAQLLQIFQNK